MRNPFRRLTPIARWAKQVGITWEGGQLVVPDDISHNDVARAMVYGEPAITVALAVGQHVTPRMYQEAGFFRDRETNVWTHPDGDEEGLRILSLPAAQAKAEAERRAHRTAHEAHRMASVGAKLWRR